jgi:hypothetical protein
MDVEPIENTPCEVIGADWTVRMTSTWQDLLGQTVWFSTHPNQTIEAQFA